VIALISTPPESGCCPLHDWDRLGESVDGLALCPCGSTHRRDLVPERSRAQTELDASCGGQVERCRRFGERRWRAHRQAGDAGTRRMRRVRAPM